MKHRFFLIAISIFLGLFIVTSAKAHWRDDFEKECQDDQSAQPGILGTTTDAGCYKELEGGMCYSIKLLYQNVAHMYHHNLGFSSNISSKRSDGSFEIDCDPTFLCALDASESGWSKLEIFDSVQDWADHVEGGWLIKEVGSAKCSLP